MLITRECDYAVRIIRALANVERLCISEICEKEGLTPAFGYKILNKLEHAGFVKSFRGSHGGYALNTSLKRITLLDLYLTVDQSFYMIECLNPDKKCARNPKDDVCKVHTELNRIQQIMMNELGSKTIQEILEN